MSFATFVMTTIVPQSNESNAGAWNQLELYARFLVTDKGKELYIVAGPQGIRGEGRNGFKNTIADGKVTVPNRVWKVILVLDANDHDQDIERVDANTRLIAVIMPNDRSVPQDHWWQYRVSVKDVAEITGYTFFDQVPADIINPLKEEVDTEFIPVLPREHRAMEDPLLTMLTQATAGLLYPSEYDAPLEPFVWEPADNTLTEVRRLSGRPAEERCETLPADAFGELAAVEGFAALYETLQGMLTDLKVYRCGAANLTVYVVGRDGHGRLAGFKTRAVET
jgi:hypothetical protein